MQSQKIELSKIKANKANPRVIHDDKFHKLVNSLLVLPKMLELRPIVGDQMIVLGGNQRLRALQFIAQMTEEEMLGRLRTVADYGKKKPDEQKALEAFWTAWHDKPSAPYVEASELSDDDKRAFIIKDNAAFGEWDWDSLANEWDAKELEDWGIDTWQMPGEEEFAGGTDHEGKETARLSELKYEPFYYEPKDTPNVRLSDCFNLEKYEAKVKALDEYDLTQEQKDVLRVFAYRFIKIDFEAVANYYAFRASDEEKKAIERLRLILVDGGGVTALKGISKTI